MKSNRSNMDDPGSNSGRGKRFSLIENFQTNSGPLPEAYLMGTAVYPGAKQPALKVNQSSPYSIEVKNEWSFTPTLPIRLRGR